MTSRDVHTPAGERRVMNCVWWLLGIALFLGALHLGLPEMRAGGVHWFNLDNERNLPTWFSATLLLLCGCAAVAAYLAEKAACRRGIVLPAPVMWFVCALLLFYLSVDEATILHENILWRETRATTAGLGSHWQFLTQWQLLFAPAICLSLGYLVLLFSHRFAPGSRSRRLAFTAVGCWMSALFVEGGRETLRLMPDQHYLISVFMEEELEMCGAILLFGAITSYAVSRIAGTESAPVRSRLLTSLLDRRAMVPLGTLAVLLCGAVGAVVFAANRLADREVPVPALFSRALRSKPAPHGSTDVLPPALADIWFDDLAEPQTLSKTDQDAIHALLSQLLQRHTGAPLPTPSRLASVTPEIVFLSLASGDGPPIVVQGAGGSLTAALRAAVAALPPGSMGQGSRMVVPAVRSRQEQAGAAAPAQSASTVILDVVRGVEPLPLRSLERNVHIDRGLDGIAFDRDSRLAFLPMEVLTHTLVNSDGEIRRGNIRRYATAQRTRSGPAVERILDADNQRMYRFTTDSFLLGESHLEPLVRGHRFFPEIDSDGLLEAAQRAGDYLLRALDDDGRFTYAYLPKTDRESDDYNILRHAGTTYSLLELHDATSDPRLLEGAQRALGHLFGLIRPCGRGSDTVSCVVENGHVKLGGNALAAIATARYIAVTGDTQYASVLRALANWMLSTQESNGRFAVHKMTFPDGISTDFHSSYYPGEAILALARTYEVVGEERYLQAAVNAARYLIRVRDAGISDTDLDHDHWLLYALDELHRLKGGREFTQHAARLARAIIASQNRDPKFDDWLGSYYRPPRSTPTAVRTEGLCAAYRLLRRDGQTTEAEHVLDAITLGALFQLQTQFGREAIHLQDTARSLGGFHRSLTDFEIRIDYVQHNISALLALRHIMREGGIPRVTRSLLPRGPRRTVAGMVVPVAVPSTIQRSGDILHAHTSPHEAAYTP